MTAGFSRTAVAPDIEPVAARRRTSSLARFVLPSIADILFLSLFCATYFFLGQHLLSDSDIGWHIRNGEHILATASVPHADYFSYTMAGRPWYAWEWLYDAMIAGVHHLAGLSGVVFSSALLFALTFAILFRLALRWAGVLPIALALTVLSAVAASIHLLARPHMFTWIFTLIWYGRLDAFQRGKKKQLVLLPLLMLVWVNLHGGFLIGLALMALFCAGNAWTAVSCSGRLRRALARRKLRSLAVVLLPTLAATLCTPYGYRLYVHVYSYLGNKFLMDSISEFLSPNFHLLQVKAFAILIILTLGALALSSRASVIDFLVAAFSVWAGLYATRNIPLAAILLTLTISPLLGRALRDARSRTDMASWWRSWTCKLDDFSARMRDIERHLSGHSLPVLAVLLLAFAIGKASPASPAAVTFSEKEMPVHAVDFMARHGIRDHFFSPDNWGGYLIYRMYPDVRLMVDDRHDFYGAAFMRDYLSVLQVGPEWRKLLDGNQVKWVLAPTESSLANAMKGAAGWQDIYEDKTAVIFERVRAQSQQQSWSF